MPACRGALAEERPRNAERQKCAKLTPTRHTSLNADGSLRGSKLPYPTRPSSANARVAHHGRLAPMRPPPAAARSPQIHVIWNWTQSRHRAASGALAQAGEEVAGKGTIGRVAGIEPSCQPTLRGN